MAIQNKSGQNNILVQLVIRDSCQICGRVKFELKRFAQNNSLLKLQVFDLENGDTIPDYAQPFVTPAIWVNGMLWYLGRFEPERFAEKIGHMIFDINSINQHVIISS